MQQVNQAWITMFRRIPGNLHDTLVIGMRTGAEIVLQKIIKLEPDFMIIRGRLSGTQDSGRVMLIPYGEMTFVSVTRMLKDPEVEAIFGKGAPPAAADLVSLPAGEADTASPAVEENQTAAESEPPAEAGDASKRPEPVSKQVLLAKLRERLKEPK